MSINKTYAVLGLGRYGRAVAEELVNNGAEVLAIDVDQNNVNNAIETIEYFKKSGVEVKVISGDNPLTVSVIAGKVGIENAEKYISLEGMSDADVIKAAGEYTVFGRVNPDQKALLIKTIKATDDKTFIIVSEANEILGEGFKHTI